MSCSPLQRVGYVVTNANDTIKGKFAELSYYAGKFACIYNNSVPATQSTTFTIKKENTNTKMFINVNSIKSLYVVDKKNRVTSTYIFNTYFWKLLFAKGNWGIYTKYHLKNEGMHFSLDVNDINFATADYSEIIDISIFSDTVQKVQIPSDFGDNLPLTIYMAIYVTKQLLPFINARYNLSLTQNELLSYIELRKPLQNQTKLFNFMLDKEAELEQTQEVE